MENFEWSQYQNKQYQNASQFYYQLQINYQFNYYLLSITHQLLSNLDIK